VLVTDAISALGLQEGTHHIGQMDVEVKDNRAYVAGTTTLCGSIATMSECIQHFKSATGILI
jgi:N-acetylglucosamine-6-phosphate deacetylase